MENGVVIITQDEYKSLLEIKTRCDVAVERLYHGDFLSKEDFLWILGTESAVELAQELREEDRKLRANALAYDE